MNGTDVEKAEAVGPVQKPAISRESSPEKDVTRIIFSTHQELYLSLRPIPGEEPVEMISRLTNFLKVNEAAVVRHEIFGSLAIYAASMLALHHGVEGFDWPVTWVDGNKSSRPDISGMHIFAVTGVRVETIRQHGLPVGRIFHDGYFKHCLLGGITSLEQNASKPEQCREVLERLADILIEADLDMNNVVRTWFFLDDIHGWYDDFNQERNDFFQRKNIFDGPVPASTGIGGRNFTGSALVAGAWAVKPDNEFATVREVASPLQCAATKYGSAFSRAVLMEGRGLRRLLISGTASIEPGGQSVNYGDLQKQIKMSREVIHAILKSCGFDFGDVIRSTGYFKDQPYAPSHRSSEGQCRQSVIVQADICRPELLFEIELDAICVR